MWFVVSSLISQTSPVTRTCKILKDTDGTTSTSDRGNITGNCCSDDCIPWLMLLHQCLQSHRWSITYLVVTGITAAGSGSFLAFIFPILSIAGATALAGGAMLMLGASPVSLLRCSFLQSLSFSHAIPTSLNALFKKLVLSSQEHSLIIYPVFCFLVGGGALVSNNCSRHELYAVCAGLLSIMPYFAVPAMTRNAVKGLMIACKWT